MKRKVLFLILLVQSFACFSQLFNVGHSQLSLVDSSRANRSITADVYYPANNIGTNVPVATGIFPVVAFGHGFVMSVSAYQTVWDSLVPHGYIMVFPATESSFSPSHSDFGKDLAFVIKALKQEGFNSASLFYGAVGSTSAAMGHSMGGGSAFLAMQYDTTITAFATMAAAETTPSAIAAGMQVFKPALVMSGANDCVAPPAQHQQPMYDSLASVCKTFVSVIGGSHCQFADYSSACYFGEGTCTPQAAITANVQHQLTMNLILPWLNFYLKSDCSAGNVFQVGINNTAVSTSQNCVLQCMSTGMVHNDMSNNIFIFPNPAADEVKISSAAIGGASVSLTDIAGRVLKKCTQIINASILTLNISDLRSGIYIVNVEVSGGETIQKKLIIQH